MGRLSALHSTIQEILLISSRTFLAALTISISSLIDSNMTTVLDGTHLKTSSRIIRIYTDIFSIRLSTVLQMCLLLHPCSKSLPHLQKHSVSLRQISSRQRRPGSVVLRPKLARMERFTSQRQSLMKMEKCGEKFGSEAHQQTETRRTIFPKTQLLNSAENRQSLR